MEVIVILDSPDNETYVMAIVAIPKGKTADQAFDQWKTQAIAESQVEHAFSAAERRRAGRGWNQLAFAAGTVSVRRARK